VRIMIQTPRQRNPKVPDIPTLYELMDQFKTPDLKRRQATVYFGAGGFGSWPIMATPGMTADRVALLREAFDKTVKDPDFLAEAKKKRLGDPAGWRSRAVRFGKGSHGPTAGSDRMAEKITRQVIRLTFLRDKNLAKWVRENCYTQSVSVDRSFILR